MSRTLWSAAADWLFPPRCGGCRRLGSAWCAECQAQTQRVLAPVCPHCGYPLPEPQAECPGCMPPTFAFVSARAWGSYAGALRRAILKLKHKRNTALSRALSQPLAGLYPASWRVEGVVPVPLSPRRLAQRGYNQVELLARPLAEQLGLPLASDVLQRQRDTLPQMDLDLPQRWANVNDSFAASPLVTGRRLLLVDDIMTSGATLHAAARALRAAGAHSVYVLTLARTL
ncbi:MAG: ComF family protein [Anaerolineales bacterium]|nr:ComF family protein [Anaerolineales bacterium]